MATEKSSTKSKTPWERPAPAKAHHTSLTPAQKEHAKARAKKAGRHYPNLVDNMHEAADAGGTGKKATGRTAAAKSGRKKTSRSGQRAAARRSASTSAAKKKSTAKRAPAKKKAPSHTRKTTRAAAKKKSAPRTTKKSTRAPAKKKAGKRAASKRAAPYTLRRSKAPEPTRDPKGGLTAAGRKAFRERDGSNLKPGVKKKVSQMTADEMRRKGSWAARFYGRAGALPPLLDEAGKPTRFALTAAAWGEPVPKTEGQARGIAARGRRLLERARTKTDT